jgi:hypothetical protein
MFMDDRAFRRERLLASGLLREVSPDEAALLARAMEARLAEARPRPMLAEPQARTAALSPAR